SGMYVRLAFAVAAHLGPEILLVDEVLAVGDANFPKKGLRKMFGVLQIRSGETDPRVARVGRWLRASAVGGLPQLWNIFVGDMSFVGPRALAPAEIEAGGASWSRWSGSPATPSATRCAPVSPGWPRSTPTATSPDATSSSWTSSTSGA